MILEWLQPCVHVGIFPGSLSRRREYDHAVDVQGGGPRGAGCFLGSKGLDQIASPVRPPFRRVNDQICPNAGFEVLVKLRAGAS